MSNNNSNSEKPKDEKPKVDTASLKSSIEQHAKAIGNNETVLKDGKDTSRT